MKLRLEGRAIGCIGWCARGRSDRPGSEDRARGRARAHCCGQAGAEARESAGARASVFAGAFAWGGRGLVARARGCGRARVRVCARACLKARARRGLGLLWRRGARACRAVGLGWHGLVVKFPAQSPKSLNLRVKLHSRSLLSTTFPQEEFLERHLACISETMGSAYFALPLQLNITARRLSAIALGRVGLGPADPAEIPRTKVTCP